MLVEFFDSGANRPIAVNPNQVVSVNPETDKLTKICFLQGEHPYVLVDGGFTEVLAKLNGKWAGKTTVGGFPSGERAIHLE
jgi:hypothetical protein